MLFLVCHLGVLAEDCLCGSALVSGYGGLLTTLRAPLWSKSGARSTIESMGSHDHASGWLSVDRRALPLRHRATPNRGAFGCSCLTRARALNSSRRWADFRFATQGSRVLRDGNDCLTTCQGLEMFTVVSIRTGLSVVPVPSWKASLRRLDGSHVALTRGYDCVLS